MGRDREGLGLGSAGDAGLIGGKEYVRRADVPKRLVGRYKGSVVSCPEKSSTRLFSGKQAG